MTKEELEKEAEELIQRIEIGNSMNCFMQLTPDRKQIGEMLVMIAEPREKRIEELEHQIAKMSKAAELKKVASVWNYLRMVGADTRIAELEEKINILENCDRLGDMITEAYKEQLTKAKELLNEFMRISKASDEDFEHDYSELIREAEQFLKEIEK